jgi:aldehyde dehydrogenase (NAD+)
MRTPASTWLDVGRRACQKRENFITWFLEISLIEKEIDHAIVNLSNWVKPITVDTPVYLGPAKSRIIYEPLGVVCIMGSWNFPLYTVLAPFIDVIAAGNCAVLKPSEISPNTLKKLKALIARTMDTNCYICLEGQVEVAKALSLTKFDCICFTGSSEKGKLVAAAAG